LIRGVRWFERSRSAEELLKSVQAGV